MRYTLTLAILLLCACAHIKYQADLQPGGKVWKVESFDFDCHGEATDECERQVSTNMEAHVNKICGSDKFRLFECHYNHRGWPSTIAVQQECYLECKN